MNRLILIGNGFDLAHGLKTSYNDFIIWYLKNSIKKVKVGFPYQDEFLEIKQAFIGVQWGVAGKYYNHSQIIDFYYHRGFFNFVNNNPIQVEGWQNTYDPPFSVKCKSQFFKNLLLRCSNAQWVDIENEFYDHLKAILSNVGNTDSQTTKNLAELNQSLKYLIQKFEEYLLTIESTQTSKSYHNIFTAPIKANEIVAHYLSSDQAPEDSMLLNFNYTSTLERYKAMDPDFRLRINYIHGKLGDESNPVIFGFGDELDEHYSKMELSKVKGYFEFIKSFWYFRTSNYHNLIRFIDSKPFQIFILGHSCGLSDRTMLNMIFEHENCKSIKIFYYEWSGGNNFKTITEEISRHFKNKVQMRRKIVPFDKSEPMPQVDDSK